MTTVYPDYFRFRFHLLPEVGLKTVRVSAAIITRDYKCRGELLVGYGFDLFNNICLSRGFYPTSFSVLAIVN